jgi:hypothetical protein
LACPRKEVRKTIGDATKIGGASEIVGTRARYLHTVSPFGRHALAGNMLLAGRRLGNKLILWQDMRGMCSVEMPAEAARPG